MAKMKPLDVSYERCHELLEIKAPSNFESESGLVWKMKRSGQPMPGSWAGCLVKHKRSGEIRKVWQVRIDGKLYLASRIIYYMHHGVDPYPLEVDHKNINSLDNSLNNLRLGDAILQGQNRKTRSTNTSGIKGVSWYRRTSKWLARINVDKKPIKLGYFTTLKAAAEARNEAVKKYFPEEVWEANLIDINKITD